VRPGKVVYSSGWKSCSGKAGQPSDRELWVGGGDAKPVDKRETNKIL
jgi:hypothetical protein